MDSNHNILGLSFLSGKEKTPGGVYKRHLRIVISPPDEEDNSIVISIQTLRGNVNTDCIIDIGEHDFIKHKSVVNFSRTRIMNGDDILKGITDGPLINKGAVSETLLLKLQNAAKKSDRISKNIKQILDKMI